MKRAMDFTADDAVRDAKDHLYDLCTKRTCNWRLAVQCADFYARKIPAADRDSVAAVLSCIDSARSAYRQACRDHPFLLHHIPFCTRLIRLYTQIADCRSAGHAWLYNAADAGDACAITLLVSLDTKKELGTAKPSNQLAWNVFVYNLAKTPVTRQIPMMLRWGSVRRNERLCVSVVRQLLLRAVAVSRVFRLRPSSPLYNTTMGGETFVCQILARTCIADHRPTPGIVVRPSLRALRRAYNVAMSRSWLAFVQACDVPRDALESVLLPPSEVGYEVDHVFSAHDRHRTAFVFQ